MLDLLSVHKSILGETWSISYSLLIIPQYFLKWLGMVVNTNNPSIWEMEVGGSVVQDHSWLRIKFQASLNDVRPVSKNKTNKTPKPNLSTMMKMPFHIQ